MKAKRNWSIGSTWQFRNGTHSIEFDSVIIQNTIDDHKSDADYDGSHLCYYLAVPLTLQSQHRWHAFLVGFSVALVKPSVCQYKHNSLSERVQEGGPLRAADGDGGDIEKSGV